MIRVIILLLITTTATAQNWPCGWSLSGDTLRFNDCAGKTVQINKTGLFTLKTDTKDSLDIIRASLVGKLAADGSGSQLTGLTKSQVGLSNVDNTSDVNKPISTAQATAIAARGYTLSVQALTSSPADGSTIYFGQLPKAPVTAAATSKIYIRKAGTIKMANIYCYSGTAGTAEAWVMNIRLNNTTDTQIASVAAATNERVFTNSSLNIAVAAGDYIEIKCVNPTWATNPLTTIFGGYIYIE